jgi:O-antigen ligase
MIKSLMLAREKNRDTINLYLNLLLVAYVFLLPIADRAKSAVLFVILLLFVLRGNYLDYLKQALQYKITQAFVLFFIVHCLWLFGTDNFEQARTILDDMKYLLYPLIFFSFFDKRFSYHVFYAFILGMLFSSFISYCIHFGFLPSFYTTFGIEIYSAQSSNNPTPFLIHSRFNSLLAISSGILLYLALDKNGYSLSKIAFLMFALLLALNITFIGGRIGYIVFVVVIFSVIFLKYQKNAVRPFLVTFLLLSLFLTFSYSNSDMFKKRVDYSISVVQNITLQQKDFHIEFPRLGFWSYSLTPIKENLLFGVGTGDHLDAIKKDITPEHGYLKTLSNTHNEYIKNILQFGLIGFLFFLNIFYQIFKAKADDKTLKSLLLLATIAIMTAVMTSMFGSKIYLPLLIVFSVAALTNQLTIHQSINKNLYLKEYVFIVITALVIDFGQRL